MTHSTITGTKPYPTYRESGQPDLGSIPAHWQPARLASVGTFSKGAGGTKDDEVPKGLPCVRYGDLYTFHKFFVSTTRSFISPDKATDYTAIEYGDILFATSDVTPRNVGKSAVNLMTSPTCCGPDLIILRPTTAIDPRFFGYLLDSAYARAQKLRMQRGVTVMHIYADQLKNLAIGLPPLDEQSAIARYLDHADELINRYISAKERLVALLEEQRQAVIHQAVTRGLDTNALLEPSDIDWLGDVPIHWQIQPLKTICRMKSGDGITAESIEQHGDYPVYGGNGTRGYTQTYTHDGDFVLIGRQGALCGNVHIARGRFWASEHAVVATLASHHHLDWFAGLLASMNLNQYSIAAAQPGLSVERVMNLRIGVPPVNEQTLIGRHIADASAAADAFTEHIHRQIDLMNEYRTRLIADAVTGQIDVRNAVPQLPD